MPQQLIDFRRTFMTTIGRDTSPAELERHVLVLDAVLAWTDARHDRLSARLSGTQMDTVSFRRAGARFVFCALRVTRSAGATLEICPPAGDALDADDRARVLATLNGFVRGEPLVAGDRLRIGFGALKNAAAREGVLDLLDALLTRGATTVRASAALAGA